MKKIFSILLCIGLVSGFVACEKDKEFELTKLSVENETITPSYESAEVNCCLKADATISEAYVHYSLSSSFAKYEVAKMTEEKGVYVAQLTSLQDNTIYYIRYSVSNKYSSVVTEDVDEFKTLQCSIPTIVLDTISDVMDSHAKVKICLVFDGGASVMDMGVCWSTQAHPMTEDIRKSTKDTLAILDLTSLQPNTKYYVRAYAINKVGAAYSDDMEFTTYALPEVRTEEVSDIQLNSAQLAATLLFDGNDKSTIKGFCWSNKSEPTIEGEYVAVDNVSATYSYLLTDLLPETQYFVRAYAQNKIGVVYGEEKIFTTNKLILLPSVNTTAITQITNNSAVAGGNVTDDGGANVTERGVCVATIANPTTSNMKITAGSGTGEYTCKLTGLQESTKYYVRAYAVNSEGTAYGEEVEFTTSVSNVPTVTTTQPSSITETTAVAGGNVTSDGNASVTERGVCIATVSNPTTSNTKVTAGSGTGSFTCNLTGLQANTTYYVRAYAVNSKGTAYGDEISFTTALPISLATVITSSVSNITETTATAGGNVTSDGNASVTERGVCVATSSNPTTANTKITAGSGTGSFTCNLSNLQAGTTYYVRAYAVNSKGTAYGEQVSFTTDMTIVLPSVTTSTITQITETSAVAGGNVTTDGNASVTERGVCISTVSNPTTANTKITAGSGTGSFTCNLSNLQAGTTYYVRAYAVNSKGTAYGEQVSFTTNKTVVLPSVTTSAITQITQTTAVAGGSVTADGNASVTERGVVYSNVSNPVINNIYHTTITSGSGTGSFSVNLTNLVEGTTYYVRAYAVNSVGVSYGEEVSFTTNEQSSTPNDGTENGHVYVDLGLSVKWATCNVGASNPEDYGDYFAWGETTTKSTYSWSTYKWCNGSYVTQTKYCTSSIYGTVDNKTVLDKEDDAAAVNWGGNWRMPTDAEMTELRNNCTWKWTTQNGVNGRKVTGPNGNSIFLPAAGYRDDSSLGNAGSDGYYWSSSLNSDYPCYAWSVYFYSSNVGRSNTYRYYGRSVRPVLGENEDMETTVPTVTTAAITQINQTSAVAGGNVTSDGGASVTERGVVYSTVSNPVINNIYHTTITSGSGTGSFSVNLTNLVEGTTYYVRAYAVNSAGVNYGEEVSFTTPGHLSDPTGTENGHGYVDLGLSVKWATCNVGASNPEDYGDYFAWGETTTKSTYNWSTYKYCNGSSSTLTKYNTSSSFGTVDNKTVLDKEDDAAAVNWGGNWRMPTKAEQDELRQQCTWIWTSKGGVNGYQVMGPNGKSIFLPAAGYRFVSSLGYVGSYGYYWSSSLNTAYPYNAYALYFNSDGVVWDYYDRCFGQSVRPVCQ